MKRALRHLFDIGLLSSPDDDGSLTDAGKLAGQLPVGEYIVDSALYCLVCELGLETLLSIFMPLS